MLCAFRVLYYDKKILVHMLYDIVNLNNKPGLSLGYLKIHQIQISACSALRNCHGINVNIRMPFG